MKADLTFSQLWANPSVLGFFFRSQSERTLFELHDKVAGYWSDAEEKIDDYADDWNLDVEQLEEMFYEESVEQLADDFEIELR